MSADVIPREPSKELAFDAYPPVKLKKPGQSVIGISTKSAQARRSPRMLIE
jgi:hypothetical protein